MAKHITALSFYKQIQKEEKNYKLVNGLFIVRYLDKEVCVHVGDFHKRGSALNISNTNQVSLPRGEIPHFFNKKKHICTTGLGYWKDLGIKFEEEPIGKILE